MSQEEGVALSQEEVVELIQEEVVEEEVGENASTSEKKLEYHPNLVPVRASTPQP